MRKLIAAFILSAFLIAGCQQQSAPDADHVSIGYFGPNTTSHPRAGDMWAAATLAIEEENEQGGFNGADFKLIAGWSDNPWGTGVKQVVRMVYDDEVWAIIGGIDGPSTHLAEQVVAKAHLVLLGPASTDKSVNLAFVPWMFSAVPADDLQAPVLTETISSYVTDKPFILVSVTDHDSHLFTTELNKALVKNKLTPAYHIEFKPGEKNYSYLLEKITDTKTRAVIIIADPDNSANLISTVHEYGFKGNIFGGPSMGTRLFIDKAGIAAEGVIFPLLYFPNKKSESFEKEFSRRFGRKPDYLATHTYDSVKLMIAAIRNAGLDRTKIRGALKELSPWNGITGTFKWNQHGANIRNVELGTIKNGLVTSFQNPHAPD
ncbi:MAG: amino acid ABC transporter substrate-binding protein [Planctomycetes bacterium]|nr:amino acid ABC transporter substrate-binding protein [Planctomycetota bacterium]